MCLSLQSVLSLFQEDVGTLDWKREHVGQVVEAVFPASGNALFVHSKGGMLAQLDTSDGAVVWRRVASSSSSSLSSRSPPDVLWVGHGSGMLFTVAMRSAHTVVVQAWTETGLLVWEEVTHGTSTPLGLQGVVLQDLDEDGVVEVAVVGRTVVLMHSGVDGHLLWSTESEHFHSAVETGKGLVVLDWANWELLEFDSIGQSQHGKLPLRTEGILQDDCVLVTRDHVVCLNHAKGLLHSFSHGHSEPKSVIAEHFTPLGTTDLTVKRLNSQDNFVLQSSQHTMVLSVSLEVLKKIGPSAIALCNQTGNSFLLVVSKGGMELLDSRFQSITTSMLPTSESEIADVFLQVTNEFPLNYFALLVYQDHTVFGLKDGQVAWKREEALASISKVEFLDLPSSHVFDKYMSNLNDEAEPFYVQFVNRIRAQLQQISEAFSAPNIPVSNTSEHRPLIKDTFGFNQLLVTQTKVGTIFGIHSEKGEIIWERHYASCTYQNVFVTRMSAFYPPECMILCQKPTYLLIETVQPLTGEIISSKSEEYSALDSFFLPSLQDGDGNRAVLIVDSERKVHVEPQTLSIGSLFSSHKDSIFFYFFDVSASTVEGFNVGKQLESGIFSSNLVWKMNFPTGESIVSVKSSLHEAVYSPALILGDRSSLEKYLNKNLLAVATFKQGGKPSEGSINMYLIDSITGSVIFENFHPQCHGPVSTMQTENKVIYTYWSSKSHMYEISVIALFEQNLNWEGESFSSFKEKVPIILQQAYQLPAGIQTIAATTTIRGITPKQILLGLVTDEILGLNEGFFDPRRPQKSEITTFDKEEGLYPYDPNLPILSKSVINYHCKVKNLRAIQTAPTYLESTSLIVAYGLDVFLTRVAPSNTFDILNSDFNYLALIATSILLLVFTLASTWFSNRRDLYRLWK